MDHPRHPQQAQRAGSWLLGAVLALGAAAAQGQESPWTWTTLTNPNWEIGVTDYGYSDYLFDLTPGFEGREYLSGEWAAAVGYTRAGTTVMPTWLEPTFSFPDFSTNSNFSVLSGMTLMGVNASGLPIAQSVIGNDDLQITQRLEMVDTVTGVAMGLVAAGGGAGQSLLSNRYALQQSYTFTNLSGERLDNLQMFQFLHGLSSASGVYDNRVYGGAWADYSHDITLQGIGGSSGGGSEGSPSDAGIQLRDYIGFHTQLAPTAVELGAFGDMSVDDHSTGKPSVGTHLSVEADNLNGNTSFDGQDRYWVAGAQRYALGGLDAGESVTFDTLLTIRTSWVTDTNTGSGSIGGSTGAPGQIDFVFSGSHSGGEFLVEYAAEDADSIREMVAAGEFGQLSFETPGARVQLFEVEYDGSFEGGLTLTFYFDPTLVDTADLASLRIFHWTGTLWENLGGVLDVDASSLTVMTSSLSPFAVGAVPEPSTVAMALAGLGLLALRLRRTRGA